MTLQHSRNFFDLVTEPIGYRSIAIPDSVTCQIDQGFSTCNGWGAFFLDALDEHRVSDTRPGDDILARHEWVTNYLRISWYFDGPWPLIGEAVATASAVKNVLVGQPQFQMTALIGCNRGGRDPIAKSKGIERHLEGLVTVYFLETSLLYVFDGEFNGGRDAEWLLLDLSTTVEFDELDQKLKGTGT